MNGFIALLAIALVPHTCAVEDRADVVEVNHFYDYNGRLVFDQLIWWQWNPGEDRHEVVAWRLLKHPAQVPAHVGQRYVSVWEEDCMIRVVRCRAFLETWSMYDRELADREILPREWRRELSSAREPKR